MNPKHRKKARLPETLRSTMLATQTQTTKNQLNMLIDSTNKQTKKNKKL